MPPEPIQHQLTHYTDASGTDLFGEGLWEQRAHYTGRRKDIWEALHPEPSRDYSLESYDADDGEDESKQVELMVPPVAKHGHAQAKAFAASTAELTGQSKQNINRSVARAEAIGPDLLRVVGTSLDKVVELAALAKLPEPQRKELIDRAEAGEKVSARPAAAPVPPAVRESQTTVPPSTTPPDQQGPLQGIALVKCLG